jgi:hypothetical protein
MGIGGGIANPVLKVLSSSESQKVENGAPVIRAPVDDVKMTTAELQAALARWRKSGVPGLEVGSIEPGHEEVCHSRARVPEAIAKIVSSLGTVLWCVNLGHMHNGYAQISHLFGSGGQG